MFPNQGKTGQRNWQLDSLRALAVTGVLIHHAWPICILAFVDLGHVGVRLFFVLSGYLITGILLRCRRSIEAGQSDVATALRRFYIPRFLRIFPPYYALLALMVMTNFPGVRNTLWWHAGYASNFLFALQGSWTPWVTSHFWSLAVEEQFYVVWPFLILLVPRSRLVAVVLEASRCCPPALLDKGPVLFPIVASMTVAMAALSWKFLEQPFNGLKRHFPYEPEAWGGPQEVLTQSS